MGKGSGDTNKYTNMPLTDVQLRNFKPEHRPFRRSDGGGLFVEVKPNGSKLWRMKELKASVQRGDNLGMSEEELAFYDAFYQNRSAVEVLGNEELRKITAVLVEQLQKNVTVDWHLKESARAKLRVLVRRILKKHGYPPDLAPVAINTVLSQAETLLKWN